MSEVRVNISTLVNASKIRRERRDGREVIIVPSATLPDNVVMRSSGNGPSAGNGIKYPAEEIEKAFKGLEGTVAPLGHPMVNGKFVSARSPEGLARGYVGASNENVRREGGRVWLDKVIDVQVANQSEGGRALLSAIDKGEPIHTSTGLMAAMELVNAADHKFVARSMYFDHDAILLNGGAAATPEQGVGMFVNSSGEEIEVINSAVPDTELPQDEIMLRDKFVSLMKSIMRGSPEPVVTANQEETAMDQAQFDALTAKVDALAATPALTLEQVTEVVANALKPITEAEAARAAQAKAEAEAKHAELVNQVVTAKLLDEATAKATPAATLTVLANSIVATPVAFRVNSAFKPADKADRAALAPKGE